MFAPSVTFEKPCEKRRRKEKVQAFTQMLRRRYEALIPRLPPLFSAAPPISGARLSFLPQRRMVRLPPLLSFVV